MNLLPTTDDDSEWYGIVLIVLVYLLVCGLMLL